MVTLEDKANVLATQSGEGLFVELAGCGLIEPVFAGAGFIQQAKHIQQRRLARARGPHHRQVFAARNFQVEMVEGMHALVANLEAAA